MVVYVGPKLCSCRPKSMSSVVIWFWLWEIGKSEKPCCVCDGYTAQNAAHLMECSLVGDGKGRMSQMLWEDEEWCEAVARFIM